MKNLAHDIYEYFSETTVHGFHYIVTGRNWLERLFWASLIVCGFTLSSLIFYRAYNDWNETPLETTIEQVSLPVEQLNYPAVTVCNPSELQMPRRNRWMYLEKLLNWIDVDQGIFQNKLLHIKRFYPKQLKFNVTFSVYLNVTNFLFS